MEIKIQNNEWPDFLERTERDVIFAVGLLLSQVFPIEVLSHDLFWWTLLLLTLGTHTTVIQRVFRAKRFITERSECS